MRLAFVDLETTGGSPTGDRITEVGIIAVDVDERDPCRPLEPIREWSTLVNPETPIPAYIQALTGISDAMVADAPRFDDLADEVEDRLGGRLFVAHNARFDHGFLRNAYRRLGRTFRPEVLCTVRLSRKLYPGYARHSLDALVERHRLSAEMRHRALGDARLLWQLWQRLHDALPVDDIAKAVDRLTARPTLPRHLDPEVLERLPNTAGVYLFYGDAEEEPAPPEVEPAAHGAATIGVDGASRVAPGDSWRERVDDMANLVDAASIIVPLEGPRATDRAGDVACGDGTAASVARAGIIEGHFRDTQTETREGPHVDPHEVAASPVAARAGRLLYVGKAKNLRQRVLSHFSGDHLSAREMEISQQLRRIEWIETGGGTSEDLGALIVEATLVKRLQPAYNRQLRRSDDVCAWRLVVDRARGRWRLALARPDDLLFAQDPDLYGPFASPREARVALRAIADAHGLCHALLKLEKVATGKPCFSHQVRRCRGACIGAETSGEHTDRLLAALASLTMRPWPHPGPIGIREGRVTHWINDWAFLGTEDTIAAAPSPATGESSAIESPSRDLDVEPAPASSASTDHRIPRPAWHAPFDHDVYRLLSRRMPQKNSS